MKDNFVKKIDGEVISGIVSASIRLAMMGKPLIDEVEKKEIERKKLDKIIQRVNNKPAWRK